MFDFLYEPVPEPSTFWVAVLVTFNVVAGSLLLVWVARVRESKRG